MPVKELARMASNLPEITSATDRWTSEASQAACTAKMVAGKNELAKEWAVQHGGERPFRRGVLIQLHDGSAVEVTREHLNRLVADNQHSLQFQMGMAPREPINFGASDRLGSFELEQVLVYPSELYGCPVIAIGLR